VLLDQDDAIGQRHRLGDVVGHQQRGEAVMQPERFDQAMHLNPGEGVERAQRLVEQQQARRVDQCPGERDALPLAAGKHRRPVAGAVGETHLRKGFAGAVLRVRTQTEGDVVEHPFPGQEARILEHDPRLGAMPVVRLAVEGDRTLFGSLEPGEQPQQRALAAATAADDGDELARRDPQIDAGEHRALAVALAQAGRRDRGAAGAARPRGRTHRSSFGRRRSELGADCGGEGSQADALQFDVEGRHGKG